MPLEPSNAPVVEANARSPHKSKMLTVGLLFVLILVLIGIIVIPPARHETLRKQAYLNDLENEARQNPTDGRLLALLGGRLIQAGEYIPAAETLRRAAANGESHPQLWLNLAAATAAAGELPRAFADLHLGLRPYPNDPDLNRAIKNAQALKPGAPPLLVASTISPEGPEALIRLYTPGSFLDSLYEQWDRRHLEQSGYATREHLAHERPKDPEAQRLWGLALVRNRRYSEAAPVLNSAVELAPDSLPTYLALGECLEAAGQSPEATVVYIDCLKRQPDYLPALLGVGKTSLATGIQGHALAAYERATRTAPQSADAWIGLGRAHRLTGVDYNKAIEAFKTAEKLAPQRTDYYDDYADALRKAVQWPAAEAILRKRIAGAPDDPLAHYLLGMVLLNNEPTPERQKQAEAETREALRLYPHNLLANIQLAQICLSHQRHLEAIDLLKDALQQNPYNRNALSLIARAYRQARQPDQAEKYSKQAEKLYADQQRLEVLESQEAKQILNPKIHEELSSLYARTGNQQKSIYEQNMAQLLRKDPKKAAEELQKFRDVRSQALP